MAATEPDENDQLIERFREQLKGPFSEIYFAEEELIRIFDVAGDSCDDYLRMEVLLVGARLYPDSKELMGRRGLFYNQTAYDSFYKFMDDHKESDSSLLKLLAAKVSDVETTEPIEELFKSGDFDDDEFVIQFVQMVEALDQSEWLINNYDRVYERVTYKPTLLYEIGIVAQNSPELLPLAIKCAEELTETDPFTADFWSLSAYLHFLNNDRERSAADIEYALALDPDHVEALKGRLRLLDPEKNPDEVAALLTKVINVKADPELVEIAIMLAAGLERRDLVNQLLDLLPESAAVNVGVIMSAIETRYPQLKQLLTRAATQDYITLDEWRQLLETAHYSGNNEAFEMIPKIYQHAAGMALEHEYIHYIHLWEQHRYDEAVKLFAEANPVGTLRLGIHFYEGVILFMTMLLRMGEIEQAAEFADSLMKSIDSEMTLPGTKIERIGARMIMADILKHIAEGKTQAFWLKYNPFDLRAT